MLTGVMNFVVLQGHPVLSPRTFFRQIVRIRFETRCIFARQNFDHARRRLSSQDVDLNDTPVRDRALYQHAISEMRSLKLRGVGRGASYFEAAIHTRERFSNLRRGHRSGEHRPPACSVWLLDATM